MPERSSALLIPILKTSSLPLFKWPRTTPARAAQTTQPIEHVRFLVGLLRWRFPHSEVRFIDTVCRPTKQRQNAAIELALQCDVVVVIGGAHSNNTRELVETCTYYCPRVHHVQTAAELNPEWFARAQTVGTTAGTSTPDAIVGEVESRLMQFAGERVGAELTKTCTST